jgi:hypothetical protein
MSAWGKVIAFALLTLFLGVLLRELGFKGSRLVVLLGTVSVLGLCVIYVGEAVSLFPGLDGDGREYSVAMLKMVGVGYAFGICSDVCRELGETGLASAVSLFGRVEILMLSMPFIKRVLEKGLELI